MLVHAVPTLWWCGGGAILLTTSLMTSSQSSPSRVINASSPLNHHFHTDSHQLTPPSYADSISGRWVTAVGGDDFMTTSLQTTAGVLPTVKIGCPCQYIRLPVLFVDSITNFPTTHSYQQTPPTQTHNHSKSLQCLFSETTTTYASFSDWVISISDGLTSPL